MNEDIEERKKLSFEQAEGVEPLPSQLQLREVSRQLRAILWKTVHAYLDHAKHFNPYGNDYMDEPWATILADEFVHRQHAMVDDFVNDPDKLIRRTRVIFEKGDYLAIFGWLEFVFKHPACPMKFPSSVEHALRRSQAAYRVVDDTVICPMAAETDHLTVTQAFADVANSQFHGARTHLRNASSYLTAGKYADSVRESIHAVEAIGRTLDSSADVLSKALKKLEQKISIHPAMRNAFTSLYAYTSDEKEYGMRC